MSVTQRKAKIGSDTTVDTELSYAGVMSMSNSRNLDLKYLFEHELQPIQTSMFENSGKMRITKTKSTLKGKLQVEIS